MAAPPGRLDSDGHGYGTAFVALSTSYRDPSSGVLGFAADSASSASPRTPLPQDDNVVGLLLREL